MITSPLAESEDSIISAMSMKFDVARSSFIEEDDGNESDVEDDDLPRRPPIVPVRDYSRLRPIFRKKGEEFSTRTRSKSYDRHRYASKSHKNSQIYATPIKKPLKITEFAEFTDEIPRYVTKSDYLPISPPTIIEKITIDSGSSSSATVLDLSSEIEFSSKVEKVEEKLKLLKMTRENSLTSMLKKQLSKEKEERDSRKIGDLPSYVEPKDPIIRELQEFLNIEPEKKVEAEISPKPTVQADEHRLIVKNWESVLKSASSSTTTSMNSNATL